MTQPTNEETSLYDEYANQQRQRLADQLDHLVDALKLDEQLDVPASLGVPADECAGEALWRAIAHQPFILTRLSRMILSVLDGYLYAADTQAYLNEQGRARVLDLAIITEALTPSEPLASPHDPFIH